MPPRALITGITGQDGSYLAELLLAKGYQVYGLVRKASTFTTGRIDHLFVDPHEPSVRLLLRYGDLTDAGSLTSLIYDIQPDEIYHLGAQSHVRVSFDLPELTAEITALGTTRLLEAVRKSGIKTRFYQASSSEMFGDAPAPQNENTPFRPRSPYAAAKVYSYWMTVNYRLGYGLYAANGILFNHESPRRGITFVTRKITCGIAKILAHKRDKLYLGNLDAKRDWGFAPEYVEAMWRILQEDKPDDFVLGTGESHSIKEFLERAFDYVRLPWDEYVRHDPRYLRPLEVDFLVADSRKAKHRLNWEPRIRFDDLVKVMVDCDLRQEGLTPPGEGFRALQAAGIGWTQSQITIATS